RVRLVGGRQRLVAPLLLDLVPERHELRGDGGVHDDRPATHIRGPVQLAQAHVDTVTLIVGGGGAVIGSPVGTGQGRGRLGQRFDVHTTLLSAGALGDRPDLAAGVDRGAGAVLGSRCRVRIGGGFGATGVGHGGAGALLVDVFGVGDAFIECDHAGAFVLRFERLGGLGDRGRSCEVVAGGLLVSLEFGDDVAHLEQHHLVDVVVGDFCGQFAHGRGGDVEAVSELVDDGVADGGVTVGGPQHQTPPCAEVRGGGCAFGDEGVESALTLDVAHHSGSLFLAVTGAAQVVPHLLLDVRADDLVGSARGLGGVAADAAAAGQQRGGLACGGDDGADDGCERGCDDCRLYHQRDHGDRDQGHDGDAERFGLGQAGGGRSGESGDGSTHAGASHR